MTIKNITVPDKWRGQSVEGAMERLLRSEAEKQNTLQVNAPLPNATYSFLEKELGKEIDERIQEKYGKYEAISRMAYNGTEQIVQGSNPFYVVAANEFLREKGLRTATQADLENILRSSALQLKGYYEDSALVLRSEAEPSEYLARDLMQQIKARNPEAKMPAMIPLSELELIADLNSPHKLRFRIKENAQLFYDLSVLNKDGSFSSEDIDENIGLPKQTTGLPKQTGKGGDRYFYTRTSGLCRLYLSLGLEDCSHDTIIAISSGVGRIVVVGEGVKK